MQDRSDHKNDIEAHLWEQIGLTLTVVGPCCAFVTIQVAGLLTAV